VAVIVFGVGVTVDEVVAPGYDLAGQVLLFGRQQGLQALAVDTFPERLGAAQAGVQALAKDVGEVRALKWSVDYSMDEGVQANVVERILTKATIGGRIYGEGN